MAQKSRPGPMGTSCLTCKRRHKRCDQRQPICERCEKGRFECLGYSHNTRTRSSGFLMEPSNNSSSSCLAPLENRYEDEVYGEPSKSKDLSKSTQPTSFLEPLALTDITSRSVNPTGISMSSGISAYTSSQASSSWFGDYVLAQSDKILEYWYFKPTNYKKQKFNQSVVERLQSSNFTRWITLVDIGIVEAFVAGDTTQSSLHAFWLDYVGGAVKRELERDRAPLETQERRTDWIHFSLMKAMVVKSSNAYRLLQGITPTFLETMFSDPTLWPDESNFMRIPLSNILASENHELAFFTSVDSTFSMAFGLPQQVEYDSTIHFKHCSTSHQWAHNTPADFQILLTEINTCRDKSPNARCWRSIEQQLIMWQSRTGEHTFAESWMTVAWYAVQESWRLALLAYLYIAVCDIPSNDPRIQTCVNQILQVVETLKPRGSFKLHASLFIQYLIAGICARTEAQRKKVRDKLLSPNETKLWLLRASDFVPVLDHLWHGVAVDGRSIRWCDYMQSRETMLPV
ncbi:unnamed protein product [Rhizoctonia solani]|uniref:Zn(2)-C6 fungal-type domain-containing protein n=1 Tax=Rhizoctonia solani TaxID=456999 RepID=A0A8H3G8Y8_9AGAM|nr:unnamed protein product [Rhizoctonia solani]